MKKFPMLIETESGPRIIKRGRQIPVGESFKVLATNYYSLSPYDVLAKIVTHGEYTPGEHDTDWVENFVLGQK